MARIVPFALTVESWFPLLLQYGDVVVVAKVKVGVLLWSLWYFRNLSVWKNDHCSSARIHDFGIQFLHGWQTSRSAYSHVQPAAPSQPASVTAWTPPPHKQIYKVAGFKQI
ncbi:hypothetical protein GOBAR_AA29495 [Gossypium barbadense]|uniref:Uncharacterized protein n=1 Tax=Gossypium barbadense TaxID=3634 RepID=A0A2P5WJC8_GOSBA|nr:hypothetical protein GOBAR_AA29495 [Gossypium barbadense]